MSYSLAGVSCMVTGAGGFLGSRIVQLLLQEEEELTEVRLMDTTFSPELLKKYEKFQGKTDVKFLKGDIRDAAFLQKACQGLSLVIHAASIIDHQGYLDEELVKGINVKGTQLLLEACIQNNVKYFIYTSSVEVMGPNYHGDPIINGNEDTAYESNHCFPYGQSKKAAEQHVLRANGEALRNGGSLMTCALRPMYIFGEGCRFILLHVDDAILNKNVFLRLSRKEAIVNPVYVGNIAWAHIQAAKAMRNPETAKQIEGNFYFISDDTPPISYSDFYHSLAEELGFGIESKLAMPLLLQYFLAFLLQILSTLLKPFVKYVPPFTRHLLNIYHTPFTFSYKKAQQDFGYQPLYSWEEAKQLTSNWIASVRAPQGREYLKNGKQC
ncbi:3 beta-hydroxysteroid dehydrogenase/Delta 5--_4-isomerase type 1 [Microcaecilia unicolor]|uniref:3 beta-hydroxysteroid dehydrogenase/Delta 5-->4-isomerase type 1 n=1 Tax=Microcaecilia unicolor TaxID=1415580 RepID=A0A6P7YD35_9AMPH|nr:3 beta-hydroxysteroid dehydrogenase/Delta 5-->4-isomerase type 1 [Microcaecilia unicolor]